MSFINKILVNGTISHKFACIFVRQITKSTVRFIYGASGIVRFIDIMPKQLTIQAAITPIAVKSKQLFHGREYKEIPSMRHDNFKQLNQST